MRITQTKNVHLFASPNTTAGKLHFSLQRDAATYPIATNTLPSHKLLATERSTCDRALDTPSLLHPRHSTFVRSARPCPAAPLPRHWPPYFHSPTRLRHRHASEPQLSVHTAGLSGPFWITCRQLPGAGSLSLAITTPRSQFKGHFFSPRLPFRLLALQPCLLSAPQRFCFFPEARSPPSLSLKPVWALRD